jgi:hypothetical protein
MGKIKFEIEIFRFLVPPFYTAVGHFGSIGWLGLSFARSFECNFWFEGKKIVCRGKLREKFNI